jgi:hypothetical protein
MLPIAVLAAGVLLAGLAYLPALDADFVFDDPPNIVAQSGIHWTEFSVEAVRGLRDSTLIPRRVVANTTFALNHLVGGLDPWGYHLVNILVHLAVGLALAWVAFLYLRAVLPGKDRDALALAVVVPVVVFLVHPLNTQAVSYVVQRMASLVALFCLLAFGAYLVGRNKPIQRGRWPWYVAAVVLWGLALGSKENAVLLPLVVVIYEVCFHRQTWREWWAAQSPAARGRLVGVIGVVLLAAVGFIAVYAGTRPIAFTREWAQRDFNGWERILTQLRVQVFYLGLLLWPAPGRLNLDHDFSVSRGLAEPASTLLAGLFWVAAVVGALALARRRPRYGFPVLAYLTWHLVEAGPLNLELVFEHRMYLPLTMLVLLLAVAFADLGDRRRWPAVIAALVVVLPLSWATSTRNQVWADPVALHWDTAHKSPNKFRPWYNLGTLLGANGQVQEALEPLERAVSLRPDYSPAHNQLGNVYYFLDRKGEALTEYRAAVRLNAQNAEAVYNVGMLLDEQGRFVEAVPYYRRFVEIAPAELAPRANEVRRRLGASGDVRR